MGRKNPEILLLTEVICLNMKSGTKPKNFIANRPWQRYPVVKTSCQTRINSQLRAGKNFCFHIIFDCDLLLSCPPSNNCSIVKLKKLKRFIVIEWKTCQDRVFYFTHTNIEMFLFEFHLNFWNTASIGIQVKSLL